MNCEIRKTREMKTDTNFTNYHEWKFNSCKFVRFVSKPFRLGVRVFRVFRG